MENNMNKKEAENASTCQSNSMENLALALPQNIEKSSENVQIDKCDDDDDDDDDEFSPGCSKQNYFVTNSQKDAVNDSTLIEIPLSMSLHSIESFVCRICHTDENPEKLVSPCLCKGSLTYVHIYCLERWISTSRCTSCELCQFQYNTRQTLRYSLFESLRIWYSRSMSRRALQEDCQIFSLLSLVAFGILGTLLVTVQYYLVHEQLNNFGRVWSKGWLIFSLCTTLFVYLANVYMIAKSQLTPWYRWWQSARDIRLILENRKPYASNEAKTAIQQSQQSTAMAQQTSSSVGQQTLSPAAAAAGARTGQEMPMNEIVTAGTSDQLANDTKCQNVKVHCLPQDMTANRQTAATSSASNIAIAANNGMPRETVIFLPINNYFNNPFAMSVLDDVVVAHDNNDDAKDAVAIITTAASDGCNDDVAIVSMVAATTSSLSKYSNKYAAMQTRLCNEWGPQAKVTAAIYSKNILTTTAVTNITESSVSATTTAIVENLHASLNRKLHAAMESM